MGEGGGVASSAARVLLVGVHSSYAYVLAS